MTESNCKAEQIAFRIGALMRADGFEPPALHNEMAFMLIKLERYIIWLRENQQKYLN